MSARRLYSLWRQQQTPKGLTVLEPGKGQIAGPTNWPDTFHNTSKLHKDVRWDAPLNAFGERNMPQTKLRSQGQIARVIDTERRIDMDDGMSSIERERVTKSKYDEYR